MNHEERILADYIDLLNEVGFDSFEEKMFLQKLEGDEDILRILRIARRVKLALTETCPNDWGRRA